MIFIFIFNRYYMYKNKRKIIKIKKDNNIIKINIEDEIYKIDEYYY